MWIQWRMQGFINGGGGLTSGSAMSLHVSKLYHSFGRSHNDDHYHQN